MNLRTSACVDQRVIVIELHTARTLHMLFLIMVTHAVIRLYPQVVHAVAVVSQALSLVLSLRCEMNVAMVSAFFGDTEKTYQWSMMALFMDDRAEWSTFVRRGTVCAEPTRMVSFVVDNEFGIVWRSVQS